MSTTEEELQPLPPGHPEAGYLTPKPGASLNAGTLPPEQQELLDTAVSDWEAEAQAIAEHEHEVATSSESAPKAEEPPPKATTTKSSTSSSSS